MKFLILNLFLLFALSSVMAQGQFDDEKPVDDYATPYNAVYSFNYYTSTEHYAPKKLEKFFPKKTKNIETLVIQLKQVLEGKGLRISLNTVPNDSNYVDSTAKRNVFMLFNRDLTDIYLEKDASTGKWQLSRESIQAIPRWHQRVYPLGIDWLVNLVPSYGNEKVFGLAIWQYIGLIGIGFFAFILAKVLSYLLKKLARLIIEGQLGKDGYDKELVSKLARVASYILVMYSLYIFLPILQLPVGLSYYLITTIRISNTVLTTRLFLQIADFFNIHFQKKLEQEDKEHLYDDHIAPIVMRMIKAIIYMVAFFHILSLLDVNVTALVAGLSIGGLAIALAAQETVKNLIGSLMIYVDRPFKIGDYVRNTEIEGTVEDIGFRSTRVRTLDTSLIAVPNGKLIDMTIDNLGERIRRRMRIFIDVPFHTPKPLLEAFIKGLREIIFLHPRTAKDLQHIHLNGIEHTGYRIIFIAYFLTNDYGEDLKLREEAYFAILELAEKLGIQFAIPSSAIYMNAQPEKQDRVPNYAPYLENAAETLADFIEDLKIRYPANAADMNYIRNPANSRIYTPFQRSKRNKKP